MSFVQLMYVAIKICIAKLTAIKITSLSYQKCDRIFELQHEKTNDLHR